jgi:hypothetical protein
MRRPSIKLTEVAVKTNKKLVELIEELREATSDSIDMISENCGCGECLPCKSIPTLERLVKRADKMLAKLKEGNQE